MVKKKPVTFQNPQDDPEAPIFLEENEELPQQIQDLIEQEGAGDYKIYVVRKAPNSNKPERIPETFYGGDGFDPSNIALTYGGGTYTFTMHRPNGTFLKRWTCEYAQKKLDAVTVASKEKDETGKQLIDMVKSQLDAVREENKMIREESKKAVPEMLQTLVALITAMKINQPTVATPTPADPLDTIIKLKSLFPENNGGDNTSKILEALKLGREFAKDSKSDGGSSPLEEKLIMRLVDVIAPTLEKKLAGGFGKMKPAPQKTLFPPVIPQQTPSEVSDINPPVIPLPENSGNIDSEVLKYIGENLKRFTTFAQKDTPVENVGDIIYQSLDEKGYDDLILFLQSGGADKIFNAYPELMLHKEWVLRLIDNLVNPPEEGQEEQIKPEKIEVVENEPRE